MDSDHDAATAMPAAADASGTATGTSTGTVVAAPTPGEVALAEAGTPWTAPLVDGVAMRSPSVDEVALKARAKELTGRSIKKASKEAALDLSIRCMDLTTLEGTDTPGKVRSLCTKARTPDARDPDAPSTAAVCVYPWMVPVARETLDAQRGEGDAVIHLAAVAGTFPAGLGPLDVRLDEIERTVALGADEIDIVLNRSLFLSGRYREAFDEIVAAKQACGRAHLKVIIESGELGSYGAIRAASLLSMLAGADFIKTSTGKIGESATPPTALVMAEAIRDVHDQTGRVVGLKLAGGIRTAKQAWGYLTLVGETLGVEWLHPDRFRFGASSLLDDVLLQRRRLTTGRYARPSDIPVA